jgi:two-component system sensor histidine kinase DegS
MNNNYFDAKIINKIIKKTIENIDSSKDQIINIIENARTEYEYLKTEIENIKGEINSIIKEVDALEILDRLAREKLAHVSKHFNKYKEADVKTAYEKAYDVKIKYITKQNEEKALRAKRSQFEISFKKIKETVESAETVINQIGIAASYLKGEILSVIEGMDKGSEMLMGIKILEAQENERKRISRDIHDGPAQHIANMVMRVDICEKIIKEDVNEGLRELSELKEMIKLALKDVRNIIFDLRPMTLDDLGLKQTIEELINSFKQNTNIRVVFKTKDNNNNNVESIIQVAIYRIIQEIFNNIHKHSSATSVELSLEYGTKYLQLIVKDNGNGFDVESTLEKVKTKGESYGILGILDRVKQLQGEIDIESSKGCGTVYIVKLPVSREVIKDEKDGN